MSYMVNDADGFVICYGADNGEVSLAKMEALMILLELKANMSGFALTDLTEDYLNLGQCDAVAA